ncbi:hypothetical protein F2P81_004804 [Scophthalmus maximus]|uniref:Uncharacterized protein n=1 Tax=Scophthalmus maximus TaxID=52904 RepID=A0A6A4TAI6_SCOMX|nr:hypothetical protein F2P81_004804 [Scophthalmus maximus]
MPDEIKCDWRDRAADVEQRGRQTEKKLGSPRFDQNDGFAACYVSFVVCGEIQGLLYELTIRSLLNTLGSCENIFDITARQCAIFIACDFERKRVALQSIFQKFGLLSRRYVLSCLSPPVAISAAVES